MKMDRFGGNMKGARTRRGISQTELANALGISIPGISQWEGGKRSPKRETVRRIAEAMGASVTELIDFSPPEAGIIKRIEEEMAELELVLDMAEQEDVSEAPGAVSQEEQIGKMRQSLGCLDEALNFFLNYALTKEDYKPYLLERERPAETEQPAKRKRAKKYPAGVKAVMKDVEGLLESTGIPSGQGKLLQGILPLLYDMTAIAIREEGGRESGKEPQGNELLELYGKLNLQGQQVAVGRLKELLQIQAYAKAPAEDGREE